MQLVTKVDTCVSLHRHMLQPIGLLMSCLHVKLVRLVLLLDIKIQNAICENCRYVLNQGEIRAFTKCHISISKIIQQYQKAVIYSNFKKA
jgi:hypothetical protein